MVKMPDDKRIMRFTGKERWFSFFLVLVAIFSFSVSSKAALGDSLGIRTIVIDPGHGGKDPGCLGKFSHEADVALAISLKFGGMIKSYFGDDVKVIYTRTKDEFVDLAERARIANRNKADLFVCIHANASVNTGSKGTETYVLGLHKTDAQFAVAQRENDVILVEDNYKAKYQNFNPKNPEDYIAIAMMATAFLDQSISFASKIQNYVNNTPNVIDRGVKQAGFLVLHQVNMPSVLIETGFLTNADEEKILNSEQDQKNIAKAIFKAFVDYKNEVDIANGVKPKDRKNPEEAVKNDTVKTDVVVTNENPIGPVSANFKADKVVFKVQFLTSPKPIELKEENFKGLKGVEVYKADDIYKYTYGKSNNFDEAKRWETEVREKGYKGAFVVAFLNGERMDIHKAKELANK